MAKKRKVTLNLSNDVVQELDGVGNRSAYIDWLVRIHAHAWRSAMRADQGMTPELYQEALHNAAFRAVLESTK